MKRRWCAKIVNLVLISRFQSVDISSRSIFPFSTMPNEKSEQCRLVHESLSAVRLFMKIVTGSLFPFFFRPAVPRAAKHHGWALRTFVLGSFALQRRVTTKEEQRFTLTINNNESTRSMCLVTDIPHFPLFIFLAPLPPALVCLQASMGHRAWMNLRNVRYM